MTQCGYCGKTGPKEDFLVLINSRNIERCLETSVTSGRIMCFICFDASYGSPPFNTIYEKLPIDDI